MILTMKVRKHDVEDMLKFNPKILEFHFSDSDLNISLDKNFNQQLIVHCYEYFDRKIIDMVTLEETNQIHSREKSLDLIQKAIDKTIDLSSHFKGTPSIVVHPGGYSLEDLNQPTIQKMKDSLVDAVKQLDRKNVNFLLENMPPYGWFFGGRWNSNIFLDTGDMLNYCKETNLEVCYDVCHSQLYCNKNKLSVIDQLKKIENYVAHYHLSDAEGSEGEGLQFGEGDLPFEQIIPILNNHPDRSFAIEVWKGHERQGEGFRYFLDKMVEGGLLVQ